MDLQINLWIQTGLLLPTKGNLLIDGKKPVRIISISGLTKSDILKMWYDDESIRDNIVVKPPKDKNNYGKMIEVQKLGYMISLREDLRRNMILW